MCNQFSLDLAAFSLVLGPLRKTLPLPSPSPFSPHPQRALLRRGPLGVRGKGGGGGEGAVPWALHRTMHEEFLY